MKGLIIGKGEVGQALFKVFAKYYETLIRDLENMEVENVEILHIAYPFHGDFVKNTKVYIEKYKPRLTIIHSSVPVGTTDQCGEHVVYSPVRGRHPKLAEELQTYSKFVFGKDMKDIRLSNKYFVGCYITPVDGGNPSEGELLKVLSNVHMGLEIAWRQEVHRMFRHFHLNERIYELWERTYAMGYSKSGDNDLIRPVMKSDPIGGHCILPCVDLLNEQYPSLIFEFIKNSNEDMIDEKVFSLNGASHAA